MAYWLANFLHKMLASGASRAAQLSTANKRAALRRIKTTLMWRYDTIIKQLLNLQQQRLWNITARERHECVMSTTAVT